MAQYAVAQALLEWYQREGNDFLRRIVAMDETWARSYELNLKRQSNEWKHSGSPRPKKVHPAQCALKVMFIEAYDKRVLLHHTVPPRQTVKRYLLLQVPAAPLSSSAQKKKLRHLVVQNPIIHVNASSHTAAAGPLAPLEMGNSGTSTVLI